MKESEYMADQCSKHGLETKAFEERVKWLTLADVLRDLKEIINEESVRETTKE